jgi:DNA polymerase-3 subunit gamma/tau
MSYTALARQWRPRTFQQLLGQNHILTALVNALNQGRIHHAYLFTGTRGVGKTSVARLFAKALNCEQGISSNPCLECSNCISIEQGRFIDLIEVDGASRTRVEDTRELLENIQYVPSIGRFKIYLIDEVHMLSQHSFNALLKTLEEPPAHVKFLLATTDPQKLPVTVLSRCLQFNLKPLTIEMLIQHLQTILQKEQLNYEIDALRLIASAARGSVRDALSILDQGIAGCDSTLSTTQVKQLLGYSQKDYALQILSALANASPHTLLSISRDISFEGGPFQYVLEQLLQYLHHLSIYQIVPNGVDFITDFAEIQTLADQFTPEDIQLLYQIALTHQDDLSLAPSPGIAFDMILLRMYTFKPVQMFEMPKPPVTESQPPQEAIANNCSTISAPYTKDETSTTADLFNETTTAAVSPKHTQLSDECPSWAQLIPHLNLSGLALSAAENAEFIDKSNQRVTLTTENGHKSLFTPSIIKRLEEALSTYYCETIQIILQNSKLQAETPASTRRQAQESQLQVAENALQTDPFFQQLKQEFSAELIKSSIAHAKDDL